MRPLAVLALIVPVCGILAAIGIIVSTATKHVEGGMILTVLGCTGIVLGVAAAIMMAVVTPRGR